MVVDRRTKIRIYAALALTTLLWAGNSIVGRAVRDSVPPFTLAFGRWTGALLVLAPFAWRYVVADWPVVRRHWRIILTLGAIGIGSFNALLYSGLRWTTATNGLLIQAAIPALVLVFTRVFFRVQPRWPQIIGVTLAALGVIVIVVRADLEVLRALSFGRGDLLIMAAAVAWALYTALLRLRPAVHALTFLSLTFAIGVLAMLPFAIIEWQTFPVHATPEVIGAFAYVAIFPSVVAYMFYNRAVAEIGASSASLMTNLQPVFGALLAAALLGESLHGYHLIGMALIAGGISVPLLERTA